MKHRHTLTLAAAVAACLLAASCDSSKYMVNNTRDGSSISVQLPGQDDASQSSFSNQFSANTIDYIVDGQRYSGEVTTEEDLTTLYIKLLGFAKMGHNVSISAKNDNPKGQKTDVVHFSSTSEVEVTTWATRMVKKGYSISIDYDKSTHTYNCTAYHRK